MLISKPERQPGSIRALGAREILESVLNCAVDRPIAESPVGVWTGFAFVLHKFSQGTNGVSRQIRSTAIEGERTPAPAKSRPAAVAVLKLQQPAHSAGERVENQVVRCCGNLTLSRRTGSTATTIQFDDCQNRSRRVVRIRNTPGKIRPRPPSRIG